MLSESTGYEIIYNENGDGKPVELKYASEKRLNYFAKASESYAKIASYYNIISASLTPEENDNFQTIDKAFSRFIKGSNADTYKELISKPILSLPPKEIFPTITFTEILKAKIEDFGKAILN